VNLKISPHTALWYKNNKDNGKNIFIKKSLSGKRQRFNTYQIVAFFTMLCRVLKLNEVSFGFFAKVIVP